MDNNPQIDQASLLPVGTLLQGGKYRVDKYLSSGNFGNTYVVTHMAFGKKLAMKEFYLNGYTFRTRGSMDVTKSPAVNPALIDAYQEKFRKEARRMLELKGQHVVHVHDLFDENCTTYYVMDFINGRPLTSLVDNFNNELDDGCDETGEYSLQVINDVLEGMKEVHAKKIWHLDLKPDNIMIEPDRGIVIIDFGASKQLGKSGKYTGTTDKMCYTVGFAAPEQLLQKIDEIGPWTDIYAIGATLYNLLTGKVPPLGAIPFDELSKCYKSHKLVELVQRMMAQDPKQRPQTIDEAQRLLKEAQIDIKNKCNKTEKLETSSKKTETSNTEKNTIKEGNKKKDEKKKDDAGCGCIILILIAVAVYFLFFKKKSEPDNEDLREQKEETAKKTSKDVVFLDGKTFFMNHTEGFLL